MRHSHRDYEPVERAHEPALDPPLPVAAGRRPRDARRPAGSPARPITIGMLIHEVARLRRYAFDAEAKPTGVTRSQFSVLSLLARTERRGLSQTELAAALDLGKVTLGGLVDRLEAADLVRRVAVPDDRRVKLVTLTPAGRRVLAATRRMRPRLDEIVLRDVSPRVRDEITEALQVMRSNLLVLQREHRARRARA